MTSHLTSIIWILYVSYRNWLNIILCVHITYYIDYYTISSTDNVNIIFFPFYSRGSAPTTLFLRVPTGLSLKWLNISMGRGNMMVEFFSAEMLLRV